MPDYILSCCSSADLSEKKLKDRDIQYICFHVEVGGEHYLDDLGKSMPPEVLFKRMAEGAMTKTSQVAAGEYLEYFEGFLKQGLDILHITLSSGISGTYNSAVIAQKELQDKYPDRKLYVVDSRAASSGFGLLVDALADQRDQGKGIDEVYAWAEEHRLYVHHWFFSTDLTYYIRGGRVSKTAGFVGGLLNICPLLNVDDGGFLVPREKSRGKKKVIKRIVEKMREHAENGQAYDKKCFISHSMCEEDAREVISLIEQEFPKLKGKIELYDIGATIGCHTGPGTVALFFWGDLRGK